MAIHLRWFERRDGTVLLPPDSATPCPRDCIEREANTLAEVEALERRLQLASRCVAEQEVERDDAVFAASRERVRADLTTTLASSHTDPFEKEFIREYLKLRDEKRARHRQRFLERQSYLMALAHDESKSADSMLDKLDL